MFHIPNLFISRFVAKNVRVTLYYYVWQAKTEGDPDIVTICVGIESTVGWGAIDELKANQNQTTTTVSRMWVREQ